MALIGKIRERMGLILVIFVGFALFAFVLGDILTSNTSLFKDSKNEIGRIAGEAVSPQEFESMYQKNVEFYKSNYKQDNIDQNTADNLREQSWNQLINEKIFDKVYDNLGISVSTDELWDMVQGRFVHQKIREVAAFKDSITGQFKPGEVVRYLNSIQDNPTALSQWNGFEVGIKKERISQKYLNLVKGGLYVTNAEAQEDDLAKQRIAKIGFVTLAYRTISDSTVQVSESDIKSYYNQHENEYKQDPSRRVEFVAFDLLPSQDDYKSTEEAVRGLIGEFSTAPKDSDYVMSHADTKKFANNFLGKGQLPLAIEPQVLAASAGQVVGPYLDNNAYKILKVIDSKELPDSVKARHILLRIKPGQDTLAVKMRADSLRKAVKGTKKFDELAKKFSEDPGSGAKGGDLGWFREGAMVKPFNDACFYGKKGDLVVVQSDFGFHVIEVMDVSKTSRRVKVAVVDKKVEVSTATDRSIYNKASAFISKYSTGDMFEKGIDEQKLIKRVAEVKEADRAVAQLEQSRELVRWAYKAKKNELSKVFQFGNKYVIARLAEIKEKGIAPMDQIKEQLEAGAKREKKAKDFIDKMSGAIGAGATIPSIAAKLSVQPQSADNITFSGGYSGGGAQEPEVTGTLFTLKKGELSKPIKGKSGVYVITPEDMTAPEVKKDYSAVKTTIATALRQRVDYQMFNALKEKADITDNRAKFY